MAGPVATNTDSTQAMPRLSEADPVLPIYREAMRLNIASWQANHVGEDEKSLALMDELRPFETRLALTPATSVTGLHAKMSYCWILFKHLQENGADMDPKMLQGVFEDTARLISGETWQPPDPLL